MGFQNINIRNIMRESMLTGGVIVDVRSEEEFLRGHIPMAINIPLDNILDNKYNLKKGATVIVYCETGGSSTMAARTLAEAGFKVYNAVGGLKRYRGSLTRNAKNV